VLLNHFGRRHAISRRKQCTCHAAQQPKPQTQAECLQTRMVCPANQSQAESAVHAQMMSNGYPSSP
jgi:hypothetical protein